MLELHEITYGSVLLRLLLATIIGGILGWERGRKNRPAGLRTYMLVCLGAAIVMMTNQYVTQCLGTGDPVRMGAQVISGIGFLGAGSIMVTQRNQIRGITTAAGLWASACVGLAIGIGFYEIALLGGLVIFFVLTFVHRIDELSRKMSNVLDIYVELSGKETMTKFIRNLRDAGLVLSNLQLESDSTSGESFAFIATVKSLEQRPRDSIIDFLRHVQNVEFVEEL
ncbi:MgtC/SapB family protein [Ruthenibacterium lactatiformans]|jgi:putative Mg2+ transporter-C (MgtC) family protein|uniref:MgtC/SapB family protein n=1 Tax=Ruthenibacterium lactatiformans TaxID=1550024 RepID=UPI00242FF14E|nr:MgtC/SapB family protein [Ruthenibacterium lactatiformans]